MRVIYIRGAIDGRLWHFHVARQRLPLLGRFPSLARKTQARHCNFHSPFTSQILLTFKDGEVVALFIPRDDSTTGDNNANHREASAPFVSAAAATRALSHPGGDSFAI